MEALVQSTQFILLKLDILLTYILQSLYYQRPRIVTNIEHTLSYPISNPNLLRRKLYRTIARVQLYHTSIDPSHVTRPERPITSLRRLPALIYYQPRPFRFILTPNCVD